MKIILGLLLTPLVFGIIGNLIFLILNTGKTVNKKYVTMAFGVATILTLALWGIYLLI